MRALQERRAQIVYQKAHTQRSFAGGSNDVPLVRQSVEHKGSAQHTLHHRAFGSERRSMRHLQDMVSHFFFFFLPQSTSIHDILLLTKYILDFSQVQEQTNNSHAFFVSS